MLSLRVACDRSIEPLEIALRGRGVSSFPRADSFVQRDTPALDLLLVVDNSASMFQIEPILPQMLSGLIRWANATNVDWQIAVTTTDIEPSGTRGRFVGTERILTPVTPDLELAFATTLHVGADGSNTESGLEAAFLALSPPLADVENANFIRRNAALAVLFISDEDDQSHATPSVYVDFLHKLKPDPGAVVINTIVGPEGGCTGARAVAVSGDRYRAAAAQTDGAQVSVCDDDWSNAWASFERGFLDVPRVFELEDRPSPSSLRVALNGAPFDAIGPRGETRFTYDAAANAIIFAPLYVPEPGTIVNIEYVVACGN